LQEESKKEEEKGSDKPFMTEKTLKAIQLPVLDEVPVFLDMPLIFEDENGITRFNKKVALALIASLSLTIKDVYRFSSSLELCETNVPVG